jgi:hypothetical protein
MDPELVALAAADRRAGISILKIGRFSLLNLSHSGDDVDTLILKFVRHGTYTSAANNQMINYVDVTINCISIAFSNSGSA